MPNNRQRNNRFRCLNSTMIVVYGAYATQLRAKLARACADSGLKAGSQPLSIFCGVGWFLPIIVTGTRSPLLLRSTDCSGTSLMADGDAPTGVKPRPPGG